MNLFHMDSPFARFMNRLVDIVVIGIITLVCCIPVVTVGASFAALYDATYRGFRKGDKHPWQRFAYSFRQNWKAGLVPTLVLAGGGLLLWGGIQIWNHAVWGNVSWAVFAGFAFAAVVIVGIGSILFPQLSRFENPTLVLLANTFRLGMANLPLTVGLGMLNTAGIYLCVRYIFPLFFLPALLALISTLFIEPMFRPYMPEETEE